MGVSVHKRWQVAAMVALVACAACRKDEVQEHVPSSPAAQEPAQVPRATIENVVGEVTLKRAAGDAWTGASESMSLYENDKLRTAPGASALLRFTSGSALTLGENALIGIAEARPRPGADRSDVTVLKGRIDAELSDDRTQSIVVTTPSATVRAGREIVFQ